MYCGIDLGSTNIKIAIYNEDFCLVDRQSRPVEYIRDGGFVEFDAAAFPPSGRLPSPVRRNLWWCWVLTAHP